MGKEKNRNTFDAFKEWFEDHKLRAVGCLWLGSIAASVAYNWSKPEKTSVKIIHARLRAQALTLAALAGAALVEYYDTLAVLAGAALVEYYDHRTGAKQERVAKLRDPDVHSQKS